MDKEATFGFEEERKEEGKEKKDQKFIFGLVVFGEILTWLMVSVREIWHMKMWRWLAWTNQREKEWSKITHYIYFIVLSYNKKSILFGCSYI